MQKLYLRLEANLRYFVAAVLLAVPLYPKFPLFFLPGTTVAVRLEDILISITVLVWLIPQTQHLKRFASLEVNKRIVIFFFVALSSVLMGIFLTRTVAVHVGLLHWARRVEYMLIFFVGYSSVKSRKDVYFYLKIILLTTTYAFAYGVGQKYFNIPVITTQNQEYSKGAALRYLPGGHLVSTFAGHYDLANFIILVSPTLYIALFLKPKELKEMFSKSKVLFLRAFVAIVIFMGLWLLVNAASRISIVSYVGGATLSLLFIKKYKYIPIMLLLVVLFVNSSSNLISRYTNIITVSIEKLMSVELVDPVNAQMPIPTKTPEPAPPPLEDRSTSIRLNVEWPRAIRALKKNPLFGTGYSSITLATDNDYLRMLGETGILGFVSFFSVLFYIFKDYILFSFRRSVKNVDKLLALGILAAVPGIFLNMIFIDILEASKFAIYFWLLLGIGLKTAHE